MKKRKVICVFFVNSITAPGALGGEMTLNAERFDGIEMFTGVEPGFLVVLYRGKEIGIPLANVKSLVWEE